MSKPARGTFTVAYVFVAVGERRDITRAPKLWTPHGRQAALVRFLYDPAVFTGSAAHAPW
jgi:hypothetical protein